MKIKLFSLLILVSLFLSAFIFNKTGINNSSQLSFQYPPAPLPSNISNNFLIGYMHNGWEDFAFNGHGSNMWHIYVDDEAPNDTGIVRPRGWVYQGVPNDLLYAGYNDYVESVKAQISVIGNHNEKALMMRPKIEWLCSGQRSDYQCEDKSLVNQDYWFYTFQSPDKTGEDRPDDSQWGNYQWVRRCLISADEQGYVVSRLRTNTEQCEQGRHYSADSKMFWYIKPSIRINKDFANNSANWDKLVCRIDIYNQDGFNSVNPDKNKIKSIDIRVRNFKVNNNTAYDGNYLDEFHFMTQDWTDTSTQKRYGDWATNPNGIWFNARGDRTTDTDNNKADIRIWWYGACDMWIDYVRMENQIAYDLFGTGQTHDLYMNWLQWEGSDIGCSSDAAFKFYTERLSFNQIPAMAYVNSKLKQYGEACGKNTTLIFDNLTWYQMHMCKDNLGDIMTADQIYRCLVQKVGATQVFAGHYPFTSRSVNTFSRIPETLPRSSGTNILAQPVSPENYDAWLQSNLDTISEFDEGYGVNTGDYREDVMPHWLAGIVSQ